jgi:hypothetical protein
MNQYESPFVAGLRSNAGRIRERRGRNRGDSSRSREGSSARKMVVEALATESTLLCLFAMLPSRAQRRAVIISITSQANLTISFQTIETVSWLMSKLPLLPQQQ